MSDGPTFVCKDCGVAVYDALGEVRERCLPCRWVALLADPAEREQVRGWLIDIGVIDEAEGRASR